uniref:Bromo domain-containing protein n=1 Tax=Trichuris muris TaxID=70415 RepID=A0A5S6Q4V2_TRIMR
MFYMREPEDLSGKDGDLIFVEYSEEHPPLLCQPGMASKIKIYNKRRPGKETVEPQFEYGETAYTHTSPFLGSLLPGQSLQALENNLFRAPIYQHIVPDTDFLVIRTRNGYSVRRVQTIFCVGQELPLFEVPSPNSKRASNFVRDFLLVFIYRLFWESTSEPRRIRMEDVRRAFPHYAESSIRKRLKICSDFKRLGQGPDANFWVLREDFRLPNLEELRLLISPELCCSYYSMLAAEQRLKDAGYGEKYFFTPEDDEEDDGQAKMADEIKCAPWNTTRAYIAATKGKCLLDVTGVADPTGCGEGYSFVRLSSKPPKEDLPPPNAKQLLRDFGVKDEEIKSLTRWEIIDVIRTLSTQQARAGGTGITKFARGSMRFSVTEVQERYKQDCQRIFELQNSVLSSAEVLSTDNEESEADDSDIEEIGKNIESMLTMKKSSYSNEEKEREELQKLLRGDSFVLPGELKKASDSSAQIAARETAASLEGRKLKITRSYRTTDGREHITVEYVTKPQLIEAYVKIRTTKDETFIKHFAHMDEQYREERRREKRRLQDQLRRIRRNEMKAKLGIPLGSKSKPSKSSKPPPPPKPSLLKMRCSACGAKGHMKTNKNCPLYGKVKYYAQSLAQPEDVEVEVDEELRMPKTEKNLVSVEGTKVKLSKLVVEHAEKLRKAMRSKGKGFANKIIIRRQSGDARFEDEWTPKGSNKGSVYSFDDSEEEEELDEAALSDSESRRRDAGSYMEYFDGAPKQGVHRRRTDPKISMSAILEGVLNEVRSMPEAGLFLQPVSKKLVPDYYKVITRPIDLQKVRMNVAQNHYVTREEFLRDIRQILDNSRLYNGDQSEITQAARQVFLCASRKVAEKERRLMKLEKAINPLLDDNDQVALSYLLTNIIQQCKCLPKTFPFYQPVDGRKVKSYYEKVKFPMDLGTMEQKAQRHQYHFVADFLSDVEQIYKNSELFNGPASMFTTKAKEIFDCACRLVDENKAQLLELEGALNLSRQKALDAAESESLATGVSSSFGSVVREETGERVAEVDDSRSIGQLSSKKEDAKLQLDLLLSDSDCETNDNESSTIGEQLPSTSQQEYLEIDPLHIDLALSDSDDEPATKRSKENE